MRALSLLAVVAVTAWLASAFDSDESRADARGPSNHISWRRTVHGWEPKDLWRPAPAAPPLIHPATIAAIQLFAAYSLASRRLRG